MANYLSNLPIELVELIYEKKHRAEMKDILNTIDLEKFREGQWEKRPKLTEKNVGHKWSLYKNGWCYEGDYTLEKILKNTYRFVDSEGGKKNIGRQTKCWTYVPFMRRKINNETMKEKLRRMLRDE
jgi:hypothetical protein